MSWSANAAVPYLKGLSWLVLSRFISSLLFDASSRTTLSCIVIVLSSVSGCCASHSVGFSAWSPDARSFLLNSALANMYKSIFKLKFSIKCFKQTRIPTSYFNGPVDKYSRLSQLIFFLSLVLVVFIAILAYSEASACRAPRKKFGKTFSKRFKLSSNCSKIPTRK